MAYIFPKRKLRDSDVLDPVEMNEDFVSAAELAASNLDQHNFSAGINPTVGAGAYWNFYYAKVLADPGFGSPPSYATPVPFDGFDVDEGPTNGVQISNVEAWTPLTDLTQTVTTSSSSLWLTAQLQYIWEGFDGNSPSYSGHRYSQETIPHVTGGSTVRRTDRQAIQAGVKFAFRVDGVIVPGTVTGDKNLTSRMTFPVKPTASKDAEGTSQTGPGEEYLIGVEALGPECLPVRLSTVHEVAPGTHTVEVVCLRVPVTTPQFEYAGGDPGGFGLTAAKTVSYPMSYDGTNRVWVMNRQLLVVDLPSYAGSSAASTTTVPAFEAEDEFSAQSIGLERMQPVRDSLNDIDPGNAARASMTHFHLPSMIGSATQQVSIESPSTGPQTTSTTSQYPGWGDTAGSSTFDTSGSGTGWYLVKSVSGTDLKTSSFTITEDSALLILADVQLKTVRDLQWKTWSSGAFKRADYFGAFCIGYKLNGASELTRTETEAFVNSYNLAAFPGSSGLYGAGDADVNRANPDPQHIMEDVNVSLTTFLQFSSDGTKDFTTPTVFDHIGVYYSAIPSTFPGSAVWGPYDSTTQVSVQCANLIVLHLKKGS